MRKLHLHAVLCVALAFSPVSFSAGSFACDVTPRQLQKESLAILTKDHPTRTFKAGAEENLIRMGDVELGLDNLYTNICSEPLTPQRREAQIRKHFKTIIALVDEQEARQVQTWDAAKNQVFPQLASQSYLQKFVDKMQLAYRPFTTGVVLAVVLDAPDGYRYVRVDDREKWKVSEAELFDQALRNLERTARDISLHEGRGSDKVLMIQENDGYDAARILVPAIRKHAAELLGEPFLVGLPNRDFIVMWSKANSADFQRSTRDTIAGDFASQPYSISGEVFEVWADGRIQRVQ